MLLVASAFEDFAEPPIEYNPGLKCVTGKHNRVTDKNYLLFLCCYCILVLLGCSLITVLSTLDYRQRLRLLHAYSLHKQ